MEKFRKFYNIDRSCNIKKHYNGCFTVSSPNKSVLLEYSRPAVDLVRKYPVIIKDSGHDIVLLKNLPSLKVLISRMRWQCQKAFFGLLAGWLSDRGPANSTPVSTNIRWSANQLPHSISIHKRSCLRLTGYISSEQHSQCNQSSHFTYFKERQRPVHDNNNI